MKPETKIGLLVLITIILTMTFLIFLGIITPPGRYKTINVMYNFAGGITKGSEVHVMGVKIGKVTDIKILPYQKTKNNLTPKLMVTIIINKKAWESVRGDSKFFINLAGFIGEKYIEITPGTESFPILKNNKIVRGEDPPRIDMMISQSYNLAGKIMELIDKNEGSVVHTLETAETLLVNFNKSLELLEKISDKNQMATMMKNLIQISGDIAAISGKLRSKDTQKTLTLINKLIWRLDKLDAKSIKKFFQKEGIKAKLF